jgi:hypothetical protein
MSKKNSASFRKCKLAAKFVTRQQQQQQSKQHYLIAMDNVQIQKRCAIDSSNPLLNGVLQNVLSYVGPGHQLFVALVSRWWKEAYATLKSQQLIVYDKCSHESIMIRCDPQMTLYSSACASPSRLILAQKHGLDCTSEIFQLAAGKHADVTTLATAHELGMQYTAATMTGAAQCNKLAEVQHLHSQGCPWPLRLLDVLAGGGNLQLLRWCYEQGCAWHNVASAPNHAAESGNVELMAWVLQQPGTRLSADVMWVAVLEGHTSLCQYLHSLQCPWTETSTNEAAATGYADLLHWLMDRGCPYDAHQLRIDTAFGGSVDVLKVLQQQGVLRDIAVLTDVLDDAAANNNIDAVKWLREQGAEWPTLFGYGPWSAEVLEWAIAEGFIPPIN